MKSNIKKIVLCSFIVIFCFCNAKGEQHVDSVPPVETLDKNNLQTIVNEIKSENNSLQSRLQALENNATKNNLNELLKKANIEKFKSDMNILKMRYEAGENVLSHIIRETNQFNLSYKQLVLQTQFSRLVNPKTFPTFTTPLQTTLNSLGDKKPIPDIAQDLSNLSSSIPYLKNPVLNSGLSVVSYFIAKNNNHRRINNQNYNDMMCVLNFITTADTEYKINVTTIEILSSKIDKFNVKLKDFFSLYLQAVGYTAGYNAYSNSKKNQGDNFLNTTREQYFNTEILPDTTRIGMFTYTTNKDDNVLYYIEQVKFLLNEYESILVDIENSINGYEKFTNDIAELANSSCNGVKSETEEIFIDIKDKLSDVRSAFNTVMAENQVPADQKRILFGL
jgi:hypothetical protein